jgi:peptidoglycan/xylan/chitin deacetylase (PgdA/CDA1 family)
MKILCYHRVTEDVDKSDPYSISRYDLEIKLSRYLHRGKTIGTCADVVNGRVDIGLSFDDGTNDFFTTAAPLLEQMGLSATVFVVTSNAGSFAAWIESSGQFLMDWREICDLHRRGFEIGSHSCYHRVLPALETGNIISEINSSFNKILRETECAPLGFAYPYGIFDDNVMDYVMSKYSYAVAGSDGIKHCSYAIQREVYKQDESTRSMR